MYLRSTKRKNKDGSTVEYLQLAHNHWDKEKKRSRVEVIHSFGRADDLDRDVLVRLMKSIARVCGVTVLDRVGGEDDGDDPLADVELVGAKGLGVTHVARALWERFGIGPAIRSELDKAGASPALEEALFTLVANRLDEPTSKLGVWERWLQTVHLPQAEGLSLDRLYTALDFLHDHHEAIEESVFFHAANLLNLEVDLIFYDTTTAEFCLDEPGDDLRQLGYSKEERWTPQVVIALAVTREGLPVRSWVFPGNTADVSTVQRIRDDLRGWKLGRTLFVGDAGMNSEDNRRHLTCGGGRYVLACGTATTNEVVRDVLGRPGRYKHVSDDLHVKEVVVGEGELRRRYLVCKNPRQAERQRAHREEVLEELEREIERHKDASTDRAWVARLRASGRYGRYLKVRKSRVVIDRSKVKAAERRDGKWVLITNDDTLSPEDAADAYKALLVIERSFRTMKSVQLKVRPMFHRLDRRIVAHVKICVLGLLLSRAAELATGETWPRLRHELRQLQAIHYQTPAYRFLRSTKPSARLLRQLKALEVVPPKLLLDASPREAQLELA